MPLDGVFLHAIKSELEESIGFKIDRVNQPTKDELVLTLRKPKEIKKLFININSTNGRVNFTENPPQNPKSPPMFCMLLRKKLTGGVLVDVKQALMDRILMLEFKTKDEIGDDKNYIIAIELMGKYSNLIVYDKSDKKILDSIKKVNSDMSSIREVYKNKKYTYPQSFDKIDITRFNIDEVIARLKEYENLNIEDALIKTIMGISPLISRELSYKLGEIKVCDLKEEDIKYLKQNIEDLKDILINNRYNFEVIYLNDRPYDFSSIEINQYGFLKKERFKTASELLDFYFEKKDRVLRTKQKSKDIIKTIKILIERSARKLNKRNEDLKNVDKKEHFKVYGDIINANLYRIKKGDNLFKGEDFYHNNEMVEIKLNPLKTPSQNAQFYYKEYKKSMNAKIALDSLIKESKDELYYLESILDCIMRTTSEDEIEGIKNELISEGYIKNKKPTQKQNKKLPPLEFKSSDGYKILCGRNNIQNDELTMKRANKSDIWFHTQKIHGAHVILKVDNKTTIPQKTIEEAAMIAAFNSKGRDSNKVAVDYTKISNVKKVKGAKPGMVIYNNFSTIIITPSEDKIKKLKNIKDKNL